jgi:hypothetical protein
MKASLLLDQPDVGGSQPRSPSVNAQGGFSAYTPLLSLAPYQVVLIGLK